LNWEDVEAIVWCIEYSMQHLLDSDRQLPLGKH